MHPFSLTEEQVDAVSGGRLDIHYYDDFTNGGMGGYGWPNPVITYAIGEAGGPFDPANYIM